MSTHCYAMVRGSVARFTRLDQRGSPVAGEQAYVTTKGIIRVEVDEINESQGHEMLRSSVEEPRVMLRGKTSTIGYEASLELTHVDPDLLSIVSNAESVTNANGVRVGMDIKTKTPAANFSMEVWSKLASPVGGYSYGYTLFPWLRGGRIEGRTIDNGASTIRIIGARTRRFARWGYGPFPLWEGDNMPDAPRRLVEHSPESQLGWDEGPWDTTRWDGSPDVINNPRIFPYGYITGGWDVYPWDEMVWDEGLSFQPQSQCAPLPEHNGAPMASHTATPVRLNTHWRTFLVPSVPEPTCGGMPLFVAALEGGDAATTTSDEVDGEFVVTSSDSVTGGYA